MPEKDYSFVNWIKKLEPKIDKKVWDFSPNIDYVENKERDRVRSQEKERSFVIHQQYGDKHETVAYLKGDNKIELNIVGKHDEDIAFVVDNYPVSRKLYEDNGWSCAIDEEMDWEERRPSGSGKSAFDCTKNVDITPAMTMSDIVALKWIEDNIVKEVSGLMNAIGKIADYLEEIGEEEEDLI